MNESEKWLPGVHDANQPDGSKDLGRRIYMKTLGGWHLSRLRQVYMQGKQYFEVLNGPAGLQVVVADNISTGTIDLGSMCSLEDIWKFRRSFMAAVPAVITPTQTREPARRTHHRIR